MMEALHRQPLQHLNQSFTQQKDWKSDLARMLYPSMLTLESQAYFKLPNQFTLTKPIRSLEDIEIETINPSQTGKLFMFRDSFANALIPYFSESFENVRYSRSFPYDYNLVDQFKPDVLIVEIAERNINWLLQQTPKLIARPKPLSVIESASINLDFIIEETVINDAYYYNAKFLDQVVSKRITKTKIISGEDEYDAFPIYQNDNMEDDVVMNGFSMYTLNKLDANSLKSIC